MNFSVSFIVVIYYGFFFTLLTVGYYYNWKKKNVVVWSRQFRKRNISSPSQWSRSNKSKLNIIIIHAYIMRSPWTGSKPSYYKFFLCAALNIHKNYWDLPNFYSFIFDVSKHSFIIHNITCHGASKQSFDIILMVSRKNIELNKFFLFVTNRKFYKMH